MTIEKKIFDFFPRKSTLLMDYKGNNTESRSENAIVRQSEFSFISLFSLNVRVRKMRNRVGWQRQGSEVRKLKVN